MTIVYTERFFKAFGRLPITIQNYFHKQEALLKQNWRDTRLHTKQLIGEDRTYSIRITREYRALFEWVDQKTLLFLTIAHRKDVYR